MADIKKPTDQTQETQPSQRELYERDFAAMNPDLDMNDEEAVYGARNKALGKLKKYDESTNRLKSVMKKSPILNDAIAAISETEDGQDFDLFKWLGESKGIDVKKALEDPEYAEQVTAAYKKNLADAAEKEAQDAENSKAMTEKATQSFNDIYAWDGERKVGADKTKENIGKMFEAVESFVNGDYLPLYQLFTKGNGYDEDVALAEKRGQKAGLQTKVNQRLANMSDQQERNGGRQQPVAERKPKQKAVNPYLEDEDDDF